jgi:hypothetical protein
VSSNHPQVIDITGIDGPFALLKISQIFREMGAGDVLEIVGCEPDTRSDLFRVLPAPSWRLMKGPTAPDRLRLQKLPKQENLHSRERMFP